MVGMARRSYDQFCGLASALDSVGERWTLLIVRDLMGGPRRYSDLASSLRGIGTSLLAERLKQLESDGVIDRRELPPPAASSVYELTTSGWELADALVPLATWGARHQLVDQRAAGQGFRPEWSLAVLAHLLRAAPASTPTSVFEFVIDGEVAHIALTPEAATLSSGHAHGTVDAVVTMDSATLASLVAGRLPIAEALNSGQLEVSGAETALLALVAAIPTSTATSR